MVRNITAIDRQVWDLLGDDFPFQGYRWTAFGERVMADSPPFYIITELDGRSVARGTFYLVRNEPLPVPGWARRFLHAVLKRWPLFICRTPLISTSGLVLPPGPERETARRLLTQAAIEVSQANRASFLVFDYVEHSDLHASGWPAASCPIVVSDPGTYLSLHWDSFDAYLADAGKKGRQHYKHSLRQAEKIGIHVDRHASVPDLEAALLLIQGLAQRHRSPSNPWARSMLVNMSMINATFLEARIESRLVGCGLLTYDHDVQNALLLGLAEDVPYVYFMLIYEGLRDAFQKKARCLRWGSGAYEVKFRLGFRPEKNNYARVTAIQPFFRPLLQLASRASI